MREAALYV